MESESNPNRNNKPRQTMKKVLLICTALLVLGSMVSCNSKATESDYCLDNIKIHRQDWNGCMTKLTYIDEKDNELGTALFYYPDRDGWFEIDNIWGTDGSIYLVLLDACPKLSINDSSRFIVVHSYDGIPADKSRWRRMSVSDEYPVVQQKNREYGSSVIVSDIVSTKAVMPNWNSYRGKFYSGE